MADPVAMTIRLPASQAAALSTVASVDGLTVVDVIRTAIDEHIALRRKDETFQQNLRKHIEQESSLLEQPGASQHAAMDRTADLHGNAV